VDGPDGEALSHLFQMPPDGASRVPGTGQSTGLPPVHCHIACRENTVGVICPHAWN